jgi:hypothetical protein
MDLLSNIWVVGAAGGLVCGILVRLIIGRMFSARGHREYERTLAIANDEILHAVRPAIEQKILPSTAMLDALFSATARKYSVDSRDLLPKAALADELIKEVIDNTFLSSQQKAEFSQLLAGMKEPADASPKRGAEPVTVASRADISDPRGILGLSTGLMAFVLSLVFYIKDKEEFVTGGLMLKILPVLGIVCIIPIIAFLLLDLKQQMTRPRRDTQDAAPRANTTSPAHRDLAQLEDKAVQSMP